MNLRFIVMTCGYVENASTSVLIYQCGFSGKSGYSSYREAITDLALDLYSKFYDEHLSIYENRYSRSVKDCCRKVLIDNKEAKYCSECGSQISDKKFLYDEFKEYVSNLHCTTCDSYGDAEYAAGRNLIWWPYWTNDFIGAPKEEVIYIAESAEQVLLDALLDAKPELKDPDEDTYESDFPSDWERFKNNNPPTYR